MKDAANRLAKLRAELEFSFSQMGRALTISRQQVHRLETGKTEPSPRIARLIHIYERHPDLAKEAEQEEVA